MKRKIIALFMVTILIASAMQGMIFAEEEVTSIASKEDYLFRILELSPTKNDFLLSQSDFDSADVKLYQYSISEYNAIREDMIGRYDIVYLGNGNSTSAQYYTLGTPVNKLISGSNKTNGSLVSNYDSSTPVYEYMPGNDATELTLGYIKEFNDAGYWVVADRRLKNLDNSIARVHKFVNDHSGDLKLVNKNNAKNLIKSHVTVDDYATVAKVRPQLEIISQPTEFDGSGNESNYIDASSSITLNFEFSMMSYIEESLFDVRLYFDLNGDKKFKASDDELIKSRTDIASSNSSTLSVNIPEGLNGLQPYKLEIEDKKTGTINYKTGYFVFRSDQPISINVLQVACNNSTFNLATDFVDSEGNNLLTAFQDDYVINVKQITMTDYHQYYIDDSDFKLTELTADNGKNYNMLIFGFADMYGNADITEEYMANDLKEFINTGQSVMFTHDNLTFRVDQSNGWSRGFTKYFRDFVGQNIYWNGDYPKAGHVTLGFSEMAFDRANGNSFTTTQKVYALNDGVMTNYPFSLVDGGSGELYDMTYQDRLMTVANTHYQYYQLDLNNEEVVVWYTLADNNRNDYKDPANYYYTYSIGNVTYSGTGHSNLNDANAYKERKLFVNTIIKAVKGANFAPDVEIQGVNNGDRVARLTDKMNFSVLATDPDVNDQYLDGTVYLDKNNDGVYEASEIVKTYNRNDHSDGPNSALENGVIKAVELDLTTLDPLINSFSIKVVAKDANGASASKTYTFPIVDSPTIALTLSAPGGMLVGDTVTVTTRAEMTVPLNSIETLIKDINLESGIYDETDTINPLSITSTSHYLVGNYASDYSVLGDVLYDHHPDIANPVPNTIGALVNEWSYTIEGIKKKDVGSYYLKSVLEYDLDTYNFGEVKKSGQEFDIEKGYIDYRLFDDLGSQVSEDIVAELYRFDSTADVGDMDHPSFANGTKVLGATVENGAITLGDDDSEVLRTGYFALMTLGGEGYGESYSKAVYLDYSDYSESVDMQIPIQPITNYRWVHMGAPDSQGITKVLSGLETSTSEIRFKTFRDLKAMSFSYDDSEAITDMSMSVDMAANSGTIIHTSETGVTTDVTSDFTHDTGTSTFTWNSAFGDMPKGSYVISINHTYYASAPSGSYSKYHLLKDVDVEVEKSDGSIFNATYQFPSVELETNFLKFLKAMDIL